MTAFLALEAKALLLEKALAVSSELGWTAQALLSTRLTILKDVSVGWASTAEDTEEAAAVAANDTVVC